MIRNHAGPAAILVWAVVTCTRTAAAEYVIDPAATRVTFSARQFGFAQRNGEFDQVTGFVALDPASGRAALRIDVAAGSLQADNVTRRVLRGRQMLDVERHPAIVYEADRISWSDGRPVRIEGALSLRGTSRPLILTVDRYDCVATPAGEQCRFAASTTFKRSDFGMTSFMGLVSDEVRLAIVGVADAKIQVAQSL